MKFKDLPNHTAFSFVVGPFVSDQVSIKLDENTIFSLSNSKTEKVIYPESEVKLTKILGYVSSLLPEKKTIKDVGFGKKFKFIGDDTTYQRVYSNNFAINAMNTSTFLVFPANEQKEVHLIEE